MAITGQRLSLGAFVLAAGGIGGWLISPRFSLGGPSLVDDWSAVRFSPMQVSSVGRLLSNAGGRYRPGWIVWNYLQWHTLGAPSHMLGPNGWDVLRIAVFALGVASFTYLLCRYTGNGKAFQWTAAAFSALAPLIVLSTPKVATDFARFGPQEPLLVGCMTLGGSLLFLGARWIALSPGKPPLGRAAALVVPGYALWVAGVYQKETSVCVLAMIPFLYLATRVSLKPTVAALTRSTRWLLIGLCVLVLAPVAHMVVEVVLVARRGQLIYGTHVSVGTGTVHESIKALKKMPVATGSYVGVLLLVAVGAQVAVSLVRRRPDWLLSGVLVTALACLGWSAQTGLFASRFYIPSLALSAVGTCLMLARLDRRSGRIVLATAVVAGFTAFQFRIWSPHPGVVLSHAAIVLLVVLAAGLTFMLRRAGRPAEIVILFAICSLMAGSVRLAHRGVAVWAKDDARGDAMVKAVARARLTGCPVAETGVDPERTLALPVLTSMLVGNRPKPHCARRAFLVTGPHPSPALITACPSADREQVGAWELQGEQLRLVRCDRLTPDESKLFEQRSM